MNIQILTRALGVAVLLFALVAAGGTRRSGHTVLVFGQQFNLPAECALMVEPSLADDRLTFACRAGASGESDVLVFQPAAACGPEQLKAAAAQAGFRDPVTQLLLETDVDRFRYRVARMSSAKFGLVAHIQVASDERVCAASFSNDAGRGKHLLNWLWQPADPV